MNQKTIKVYRNETLTVELEGSETRFEIGNERENSFSNVFTTVVANNPDDSGRQAIIYAESKTAFSGNDDIIDLRLPANAHLKAEFAKKQEAELLKLFSRLCEACGKTSRGFDVDAIDEVDQWALKYTKNCGWMIVCGLGGHGCAMTRWNGYVESTRSMLIAIEIALKAANLQKENE